MEGAVGTAVSMEWSIRAIENRDVDAILAIQSASPEIAQWTLWDYDRVARGEMAGWVAEENGRSRGFSGWPPSGKRSRDSEFCGAHPIARRRGVGTALLAASARVGQVGPRRECAFGGA